MKSYINIILASAWFIFGTIQSVGGADPTHVLIAMGISSVWLAPIAAKMKI